VRVVCPNAKPEINDSAAVAAKIARMFAHFMCVRRISGGSFRNVRLPPR
jgi:hypothetical protein